jgi:putative SOS response-associated peptidase YedK
MTVLSKPMCERYVLSDQLAAEREFLPSQTWWKFAARYNVAPPQYVPAIRVHDGRSEGMMLRWGLIPAWAEGQPTGDPTHCADVDGIGGVERSVLYRMPWLSGQRCILPAAGFYVWRLTRANYRQPYFVRLISRAVFGVAAVWDRSVGEDDDVIESCAIIRVPVNSLMAGLTDAQARMPAILRRRDYETWLRGTPVQAKTVLRPYSGDLMQAYPVSPRINSTEADDAGLISPVESSLTDSSANLSEGSATV